MKNGGAVSVQNQQRLATPGRIGTIFRGVAAWIVFSAAVLAFNGGGLWLIAAGGFAAFGLLLAVAALVRQPGCEVKQLDLAAHTGKSANRLFPLWAN